MKDYPKTDSLYSKPSIKTFHNWIYRAREQSKDFRMEIWIDHEMIDGDQWSKKDLEIADLMNVSPITINKTFTIINYMRGMQRLNRYNVIAKARTSDDTELSRLMSGGIQFVLDQNNGIKVLEDTFRDGVSGFGCMAVLLNGDPRKEVLHLVNRDWKDIYWDNYGSPDFDTNNTRYVFYTPWMDIKDLQSRFPDKEKQIAEEFKSCSDNFISSDNYGGYIEDDPADMVEDEKSNLIARYWINYKEHRVRPVEMWYTVSEKRTFALYSDGRAKDITELLENPDDRLVKIIVQSNQVVTAVVKKMHTATLFNNLILEDKRSPFEHDEFPFICFYPYKDRYDQPYGVARQIRGMDIELNRRRAMFLALLGSKRVIMEEGVASDSMSFEQIRQEAHNINPTLIVKRDAIGRILITENQGLAGGQLTLLDHTDRDINEVTGVSASSVGERSNVVSRVAIDGMKQSSNLMVAPVFANWVHTTRKLGELIGSGMQTFWGTDKIIRISGDSSVNDEIVTINQRNEDGTVTHDITQDIFDYVVSEAPASDTVREQQLNLIIEWVKKSPPEIIPQLMVVAFELSDLPNKDKLMEKIKPLLGINPIEEELTPEQRKQKIIEELQAKQQQAEMQQAIQMKDVELDMQNKELTNKKIQAEIENIYNNMELDEAEVTRKTIETGAKVQTDVQDKISGEINNLMGGQNHNVETNNMVNRA